MHFCLGPCGQPRFSFSAGTWGCRGGFGLSDPCSKIRIDDLAFLVDSWCWGPMVGSMVPGICCWSFKLDPGPCFDLIL